MTLITADEGLVEAIAQAERNGIKRNHLANPY